MEEGIEALRDLGAVSRITPLRLAELGQALEP